VGKSPITSSRNLSVILDSYDIDGDKILIAIVGPKRMDYDKNLQLFKLLREYIEE
jgi:transcriptional regulator of heat shock response